MKGKQNLLDGFGFAGPRTSGGRGGEILRVTNLNDSGPGSLRAALEASGRQIVIFETSGMIILDAPICMTRPFVTVAGQTSVDVTAVRHARTRTGERIASQRLR